MKTFSVAVVAAVLLALICLQESSALPLSEVEDVEVPVMDDNGAAAYEEMPVDSWKMPYTNMRHHRPARCRFCCRCCPGMQGCGICCDF
ncbi:hepcidin-like [Takifugu flavidus]|uniref:hepcidin-like n=1 Tax=Takifugu flavidus TaxID=433684 RepID=UPI002544B8DB|nr:hepcidin-like [Takifugu flavidus]